MRNLLCSGGGSFEVNFITRGPSREVCWEDRSREVCRKKTISIVKFVLKKLLARRICSRSLFLERPHSCKGDMSHSCEGALLRFLGMIWMEDVSIFWTIDRSGC